MKKIYLILSIIWIIIPYYFLISWLHAVNFDVLQYLKSTFTNLETLFWLSDVVISAIALLCYIIIDGKKNNLNISVPIIWTFLVWVSFWLPYYLYLKEKKKN